MFHGKRFDAPPACSFAGAGGRRGVFFRRFGMGFVEAEAKDVPPSTQGLAAGN
jgi:hypothetical protein